MKINKDVLYNINNEFMWNDVGMCTIAPVYGYRFPIPTHMYTYLDRGEAFVFVGGVKHPISDYYDETSVDRGLLLSLSMASARPFSYSHVEVVPRVYKDYVNYFYIYNSRKFLCEFKKFLTQKGETSPDNALRDNYPFIITFPMAYIKAFVEHCDLSQPERYGIGIEPVESNQQVSKKHEWRNC